MSRIDEIEAYSRPDITFGLDFAIHGTDAKWLLFIARRAETLATVWESGDSSVHEGTPPYLAQLVDALCDALDLAERTEHTPDNENSRAHTDVPPG